MFWSYGPFTVVSHSLCEQLVPRVVEFNFGVVMNLEFWDFEEWANRANIFPVFPVWSKGCLNNVCTWYTLESGSRCVQDFEVAGDFGPVFVGGKAEYIK